MAKLKDDKWTIKLTDWRLGYGKRSRGKLNKRWRGKIDNKSEHWEKKRHKAMCYDYGMSMLKTYISKKRCPDDETKLIMVYYI